MEHSCVNGIDYTFVNGTRGTLNMADSSALEHFAMKLLPGSKYLEIGSYLDVPH